MIEMIDPSEGVDEILGLFRKRGKGVDEVTPGMSETVCENGYEGARQIPAQSVTHLDWGRQLSDPLSKEILKVFPAVVGTDEEVNDAKTRHGTLVDEHQVLEMFSHAKAVAGVNRGNGSVRQGH